MLPILRIIPVGGVLLAIAILVLALRPPVGPHAHFTAAMMPARGPLIAREQHPEWRQFLILAALRRADELSKLRDLPDTPTRTAPLVRGEVMQPAKPAPGRVPDATELAGVHPSSTGQDDITGTVPSPDAAIPVDIGETSSAELPVIPHKELPPVTMMPARQTAPDNDASAQPAQEKPQTQAVPEPAKAKQASREAVPPPAPPKQESKAATPEPVPPKPESKAAAPPPATSKQASREPAPTQAAPKRNIRQVTRQRAKPRHLRVARRARRSKKKQDFEEFDFFRALFGFHSGPPGGHVEPTSVQ